MKNYFKQWSLLILLAIPTWLEAQKGEKGKAFYQVTIFHFAKDSQQTSIDVYLERTILPAVHRQGLIAGIFKPVSNDTAADKTAYVILEFKSWKDVLNVTKKLAADTANVADGRSYIDAPFNAPPFSRKEVILMEAFPMAPMLQLPTLKSPKADHVYEWRSYESATEKLHRNKVKMFNEGGEVTLFARLQFNAIFYSAVVAGCRMPNLIYMTSFENMDERNEHWKTFSADAEWKKLSSMPEYQNNVSKADIILMKAAPYSDY